MTQLTPEIKAQLEEQKKQCVFCKILKGEIPSEKVYDDKEMFAILDVNPWTKGHTLLMPKEHYPIMPLIPPDTFKHMFGMLPKVTKAINKAMLGLGLNILIANGGAAGQQAPHFLIHILPREPGDKPNKFLMTGKEEYFDKNTLSMLSNNLTVMMRNHFSRNPQDWHNGDIKTPDFLKERKEKNFTLYEDEKSLVISPKKPLCKGHMIVLSTEEEKKFENLSFDSSSHLFFTASFCATATFEGLKAQGTNIILKSGSSDDNPKEKLEIHIIPRYMEDNIDIIPSQLSTKPDLKSISKKIKDKTFMIEHELKEEKKEKQQTINLNEKSKPIKIKIDNKDDPLSEIKSAIDNIKRGNL